MKKTFLFIIILLSLFSPRLQAQGESEMDIDPIRTSFYVDKFQRNVVLFGFGDEPIWSLELNRNKSIELLIEPDLKIIASVYSIEEDSVHDQTTYFAKFDRGHIQFSVSSNTCRDNISGRNYAYISEVHYHDTVTSEYKYLKGCVEWIPNFRLHEIWMLYQINDEIFDKETYYKNVPRLEFHIDRLTVSGFGGCNEFQGKFELNKNKIQVRKISLFTEDNCELSELEANLIKDLQENSYSFQIEEGFLKLKSAKNTMIFRRTD